jgi:O-antigen ligase
MNRPLQAPVVPDAPAGKARAPVPRGTVLGFVAVGGIYLFHALYGAFLADVSMLMVLGCAGLLAAALLAPWGGRELAQAPKLMLPGLYFLIVLGMAAWSLTPWTPDGPSPAWSHVRAFPSASIDPSSTLLEIAKLLGLGCLFVFGVLVGGSDERGRKVLRAILYGGTVFAVALLAMFLTKTGADADKSRLEGAFRSANTAGTVFGMLVLLSVAETSRALRRPSGPKDRAGPLARAGLPAAMTLILVACLAATQSRGALSATAIALSVQLVADAATARGRIRWGLIGGVALLGLLIFAAPSLLGQQVLDRFLRAGQDVADRRLIAAVHWNAFLAAPINGYGLGSFDAINRALIAPDNFQPLWIIHAVHNLYIQWLEEAGVLGAVAMFATVGSIVVSAAAATRYRTRARGWLHALIACDILVLLHGLTDFALQTPSVAAFWTLLLGLQLGLAQGSLGRGEAPPGRPGKRAWVCWALAGAAGGLACLFLYALNAGGAVRVGPWRVVEVATGYDRLADRILEDANPHYLAAEAASESALHRFPYDTSAWLRIAYIEGRASRLRPAGLAALQHSYDLVAVDPDMARWRVLFCLERWNELTPRLQEAVKLEGRLLASIETQDLKTAVAQLRNPAGRAVADKWFAQSNVH